MYLNDCVIYQYEQNVKIPVGEGVTYIQNQFSNSNAASSAWIILKRFGQTVEGLELLIILLVLYLKGHTNHLVDLTEQQP